MVDDLATNSLMTSNMPSTSSSPIFQLGWPEPAAVPRLVRPVSDQGTQRTASLSVNTALTWAERQADEGRP